MNEILLNNFSMPVVNGCDLMAASEPFFHADRILDFNVMIYVTDGIIYVTEDETDYSVSEGELLFLKKGCHHFGKTEIPRGTRWYFIHFYLEENGEHDIFSPDQSPIPAYTPVRSSLVLPKKLSDLNGSVIEKKISAFNDYYHSSETMKKWDINSKLWELLGSVAVYNISFPKEKRLSDRICIYLNEHFNEKFNAMSIEKEFYLSYKYMSAVFKKEQNMTMQQYHNSVRMEEASKLLRSTLLSVGEISDKTGFSDMLYFSRCFHSYYGVSPTEYRKKSKNIY